MMLIKEAATQVGTSEQSIRRWCENFGLDVYKNSRGQRVFSDDNLDDLICIKNLLADGETYESAYEIMYGVYEPSEPISNTTNANTLCGNECEGAVEGITTPIVSSCDVPCEEVEDTSTDPSQLLLLALSDKRVLRLLLICFAICITSQVVVPRVVSWWQDRQKQDEVDTQLVNYPSIYDTAIMRA